MAERAYVVEQRWLESTKNYELRDAQNFRGIPGSAAGARLASQQGVRGAPIADANCVPGLEFFKVSPLTGTGDTTSVNNVNQWSDSGDYLWATASNLDLSLMMWNGGYLQNGNLDTNLMFGVMLRGDTAANVQPNDVFGAPVSEIVLVSGTLAWRIRMPLSNPVPSPAVLSNTRSGAQHVAAGATATGNNVSFNGISSSFFLRTIDRVDPRTGRSSYSTNNNIIYLTQFPIGTPLPFAVYRFGAQRIVPGNDAFTYSGGEGLLSLLQANYAGFRVYDFTLMRRDGNTWQHTPAAMPQSLSGLNTTSEQIPDPDDISQNINNPSFYYIEDAVVAPPADRAISTLPTWNVQRSVAVNTDLAIANVATAAFSRTPATASVAIQPSPTAANIANATYTWNPSTYAFSFRATEAGDYRIVFTAALTEEPGRRAEAVLNITVS